MKAEDGIESVEDLPDFWEKHLAPSESNMKEAFQQVRKYLPGVSWQGFSPDCGLLGDSSS
jgi:2-hydroxyglutarate dehydrogenase